MQVEIRNRPSFANLFITLLAGESLLAESDAMGDCALALAADEEIRGLESILRDVVRRIVSQYTIEEVASSRSAITSTTPSMPRAASTSARASAASRALWASTMPGATSCGIASQWAATWPAFRACRITP